MCDLLQQLVTDLVAEGVVERLEVVQVDQQQGTFPAGARTGDHGLLQPVHKQPAVGQEGERVVKGEIIELFLLVEVVDCERYIASQFRQQLHLFFMEEFNLAGIQ